MATALTHCPTMDTKAQVSFKEWEAALRSLVFRRIGIPLCDLPNMPVFDGYDSGSSVRDFYDHVLIPRLLDEGFTREDVES